MPIVSDPSCHPTKRGVAFPLLPKWKWRKDSPVISPDLLLSPSLSGCSSSSPRHFEQVSECIREKSLCVNLTETLLLAAASAYRWLNRTAKWLLGFNGPLGGNLGLHQFVSLRTVPCCLTSRLLLRAQTKVCAMVPAWRWEGVIFGIRKVEF